MFVLRNYGLSILMTLKAVRNGLGLSVSSKRLDDGLDNLSH